MTSSMTRYSASFAGWLSPAAIEVLAHAVGHGDQVILSDARVERQRQALAGEGLGDGKRAAAVTEPPIGLGQVDGIGIVPPGSDAALAQEDGEALGLRGADDVEM